MSDGFPYVGNALGVAQLRESRTLVNMGNQPHCDNGEGEVYPLPYPLRVVDLVVGIFLWGLWSWRQRPQVDSRSGGGREFAGK